ncbi:MAG TPA: hypothetical protein ENN18_10825 [Proteobacteria bacterium]|nr:hypothetical protein [Pseudomonadota bacterium]
MKPTLSFYTIFFFASLFMIRLSGLLVKVVLARSITPYEYGIITLVVLALPAVFSLLTNFCFYDVLSHGKNGRKYFSFSILYTLVVTAITFLTVFIFHESIFNFLNLPLDSWRRLYTALIIVVFPTAILVDLMGLAQGFRKYTTSIIISSLPPILRLLFVLIVVYILRITDFSLILLIFALPSLVTLIFILSKESPTISSNLRSIVPPSKSMLFWGFSIFLIGTFAGLGDSIVRIVVSHDLGLEWQAYFDVSLTLVSILTFFSVTLHFISIPEATSIDNREELLLKSGGLGDVARALFSYLIFSVIVIYFYSHELINFLFSESYALAADYAIILAIGFSFFFVQQFLAYINVSFYQETQINKTLIFITSFFLIFFPIFTHVLIRILGFLGAYISLTLSLSFYTLATIITSKDLAPIRYLFAKGGRLLVCSLITFILAYYIKLSLLYGLIVYTCVFTFLIFSLGYLNVELIFDMFSKNKSPDEQNN